MSNDQDAFQTLTFKLKLILKQSHLAYIAALVNSLLYLYLTWNEIFRVRVILWVIAVNLMSLARFVAASYWNFDVMESLAARKRKHVLVTIGTAISGTLWGMVGWNYFDTQSVEAQSISLFLLAGMTAGATGAYSHSLPVLCAFVLPAMTPLVVRSLALADPHHAIIAIASMLYLGLLFRLGQNTNHATAEAIRLSLQNEFLEAEQRAASRLLANVSHEIRTPLTAILGYADLLTSDSLDQKTEVGRKDSLEMIKTSGEHLLTMVNDLLDVSRLSAGKADLVRAWFSPADEIANAVRLTGPANTRLVPIEIKKAANLPGQIYSDAKRFRQVLINLLSNAIKFTPRGRIEISATFDPSSQQLVVDVSDTGIGLDPPTTKRIFQPFSRSLNPNVQGQQGSGLGLALSKDLARLLGGDLTLKHTSPGRGSTFSFSVDSGLKHAPSTPAPAPAPNLASDDLSSLKTQLSGHSVLIVDDTPELLTLISRILNRFGLKVDESRSGSDAIEKATRKEFDLILMDLSMPGIDGFQAAHRIRRRGYHKPILALTAHATDEHQRRCLSGDFNGFLRKPIDQRQLLYCLVRWTHPEQIV